ncbi:hypothetical protein HPB51_028820 [Rhipicephalus microplus]|uniref:Uncharacterized protein n=1 Tax=Rhipicephalus microplus TaxID=6941 RepID=A0A9J6CVV8_RHIMP|nr:hypothetical protein HPB51_028820 [Rhipicephalus microplus]
MSKDAYDGLAQNLTEKMKRTLTPASDGVFSKNCLGMVTVKGIASSCTRGFDTWMARTMMRDLIEIMSSRFPAKALRPDSAAVDKLLSFLAYLVEWEVYVAENLRQAKNEGRAEKRGRFLSESTAVGLRVTIASVLSLLDYLSQQLAYKLIMTSRLSQDPAENFFGIARQVVRL